MATITNLPFDLTGSLASNLRTGEERTLTKVPNRKNRMLAPKFGAFYKESLEVRTSTGVMLKEDTDYVTTYYYPDIWQLNAKPVCAIIVIINEAVESPIRLKYQALGGAYALNTDEIADILNEVNNYPESVKWEDIINKPLQFAPAYHEHEYWQLYGLESTVLNLELLGDMWVAGRKGVLDDNRYFYRNYVDLAQAAVDAYTTKVYAHINDQSNPHKSTKTSIGLSQLNNWGLADQTTGASKTADGVYQSIGGVYDQLTTWVFPALDAHVQDTNNPHKVLLTDPLLNLYSTQQINDLFAQKLAMVDVAYDSSALTGNSATAVYNNIRTAMSTSNIRSDALFNQDYYAQSLLGWDPTTYVTMGDNTFKKLSDVYAKVNGSVGAVYFIGSRAVSGYLNLPVGTYLIRGEYLNYYAGAVYQMNLTAYVRTESGYTQIF